MTGSDFLQLDPTGVPARGLTDWLVAELRTAIAGGRVARHDRLPPTRVLAADLGLSRGVVVEAYGRLTDEALVEARPKVGTVVVAGGTAPSGSSVMLPAPAPATGPTRDPALSLPHVTVARPAGTIDLSPGVPDLSTFPRAAWLRAERWVLDGLSGRALGYGDPRGDSGLRAELASWLTRTRGVRVVPDDVLVVDGVAQALALLAQVLLRRGHTTIAVEDPGSRGARDQLAYWRLAPVPIPVDEQGLRTDILAGTETRAVLLTPAHQFPTGVVLAPERRRALLEWAEPGRLLVEDDYDAEYRYDRAPVAALQASAPDRVAYTGSTSKTLAPALRLGWLVAPAALRAEVVDAKHASDLGSPVLPQLVLAHLISTGQYDGHVRRVRTRHRARRDALRDALAALLPDVRVHGVAAGLHLLVTLPGPAPEDRLLAERLLDAGVVAHPLSWHRSVDGPPGLVLGYAATTPDRLLEAVARIATVLGRSVTR